MRNVKQTFGYQDTIACIRGMFLTYEFQECTWVQSIASRAASRLGGLGFYDESHPCEHGHFTTWMGLICRRQYENPYIHDLYLLHELAHLESFAWRPDKPFSVWFDSMNTNEFNAALTSEVYIYFWMRSEGLPIRHKTFPHRIWADRWLERTKSLSSIQDEIIADRKMKIQGFFDRNLDGADAVCDHQISRYAHQNYQWAKVWENRYNIIETSAYETSQGEKSFAEHYATLSSFADDSVFFLEEALEFDKIYRNNNELFGEFPGTERSLDVCAS